MVTGSSTHLQWGETEILVDCGLYQGGEEDKQRNWEPFGFAPHKLTAAVVTHAHLDHTGLLPKLVAGGFDGPIYCTKPSRGLISLILEDAGRLQEEQVRYARKKGYSRHPSPEPLYTSKDARRVLRMLRPLPFDEEQELAPGVQMTFYRAGHLLGAASVAIRAKDGRGKRRTWCFSGDVGRYDVPILKDPATPDLQPDTLVLESTYGDRRHIDSDPEAEFRKVIRRTFSRGGKVVIPAFALGRSQEVLYHLSELVEEGVFEPDVVFLDSPMALKATDLYERATAEHDEELAQLVEEHLSPLDPDRFQRCRRADESKALNHRKEPAVIVAASGMATGGRVVHHLKRLLSNERNTVIFVGYQAAGTRGRALVNGAKAVAIHGDLIPVEAEILSLHGLSAHADREELLRWCSGFPSAPGRIFLNHGEDPARKALAAAIAASAASGEGDWPRPELPLPGTSVPW